MKKELTLNANACQGQSTTSMADMAAKIAQRLLAPAANYYSRVLGTKVSIRQALLLINAQAAFVMAVFPSDCHIALRAVCVCWLASALLKCRRAGIRTSC